MPVTTPAQRRSDDPVVAAMERVLKVERDGVAALRQSEAEAQRILADARAQADAIRQRVSARISRLHAVYLQKLQAGIGASAASAALADPNSMDEHERVLAAARRVAARLTEEE
jgi:regulator of protease activity HflC (stomatin/prohibitin superfamily)